MKRFDKGYIYSSLLSDFFGSLVVAFIFLKDFFLDESTRAEDKLAAIPFFIIGFAVIYLFFIVYRILYYRASGYELTDNEIKCNTGVLFKKRSVLEYRRVHAINKKQSLFHRAFGIAVLTVDSGSTNTSHQAEITIIEKEQVADALLRRLNALKQDGAQPQPEAEILLSDEDSLYRFTSGRKMVYTLINILSTAFFTALFAVLAIIVLGICKLLLQNFLGTWGQYFLYGFLITLGAMLLLSMFSFIGCLIYSFIGYYGFKITRRGDAIEISYGLLEKHTNTFGYDRIKAVKITQGLVQRLLGFASIRLEVIGYTVSSGDDDKNAGLGVLVPFCRYDEVGDILAKVLPDYVPDAKQTRAVSYFPFISWFSLTLGILCGAVLLSALPAMALLKADPAAIIAVALSVTGAALLIFLVKAISAALSCRNNGLAVSGNKITAYDGGFTKNITVFYARNLIAAESITTPLRQKAGIASLVMHLKTNALSNEIKVHIQKDSLSKDMEKLLIL